MPEPENPDQSGTNVSPPTQPPPPPPAPPPPPPPPAPPKPATPRLHPAGAAALAAAHEGRCLYRGKSGYSLSGTGGKQHTFPVVGALTKAGLLREVPSGGAQGSVKITDAGLKALRAWKASRAERPVGNSRQSPDTP